MKKKKNIIIPLMLVAFVVGVLIIDSIHMHSSFSRNWDTISEQFEIVNDYAMTKFPAERNYIQLSDLDDTNDDNINNALSAVREYLNNYFEYTCMERYQYILIHIKDNKKQSLKFSKKFDFFINKYIIDKLGDGWYLVFQHHI